MEGAVTALLCRTSDRIATTAEGARALAPSVPVVLMCYANMVFAPGVEAFAERLARAGACGLIVPDLPQGEAEEALAATDAQGLALVPLVAPTTTPERLAEMFPGTLKHHLIPLETSGQYFNYDPLV